MEALNLVSFLIFIRFRSDYFLSVISSECSDGCLSFDRCPMHFSSISVVIVKCSMQANTVIPDGDCMRLPS